MKKIFYTAFYFCSALLMSSCIGDLDQYPHEEETSSTIYTSAANYKAVLGKIYAAMVTTGQEKPKPPPLCPPKMSPNMEKMSSMDMPPLKPPRFYRNSRNIFLKNFIELMKQDKEIQEVQVLV